jgi:predicted GNAT family acetyltransferase
VDGTAVSMAAVRPSVVGLPRVSLVYTPAEHRRHGYAGAGVAALSQHLLDDGARACMLFADLANPTSNGVYQRIGYRPVADADVWRFN